MSKYTARQIAESDELFEKQIHKVRKFYLSRNPDKMMMLEERKAVVKERNRGLSPEYDKEYYCGTCGAKDGAEHPKSGYCFHCDTDNWISKNYKRQNKLFHFQKTFCSRFTFINTKQNVHFTTKNRGNLFSCLYFRSEPSKKINGWVKCWILPIL